MKIAIIASIWISVPPKGFGFGAQEYLAYSIAEGLKKKGHDVTLFATADSHVSTKLVSVSDREIKDIEFPDPKIKDIFELMNLEEAYKISNQFDLIHNHLLPYGLLFSDQSKTPTVHTLHHQIYQTRADIFLYKKYASQNFISISNVQRSIMPELHYISTVYNGIDSSYYSFKNKPSGNYLLYLGRMKQYKGIHTAIQLAKELKLSLKIVSPLPSRFQSDYTEVNEYWESKIKPQLGASVEHIDTVEGNDKIALIQNAKALIFPVEREEPFGMTIIEAMSCGTPVIAYDRGAVPELVIDQKTGYIVHHSQADTDPHWFIAEPDVKGLKKAILKLYSLSELEYNQLRYNSRKHVEQYFTAEKMVENYEKTYQKILK